MAKTKTTIENPYFGWSAEDRAGALTQAVINCMYDIDNVEKNTTVGEGRNSYSGVGDKDVKIACRKAMAQHGLIIIPMKVTPRTDVMVWQADGRRKQQVFVEVTTVYKLSHISGAFEILEGIGHGVDSMDKAAGKATTYALKYALLYLFLIPSGKIDDADKMHSDDQELPPADATMQVETPKEPLQPLTPVKQPEAPKEKAKGTAQSKKATKVTSETEPELPAMMSEEVNGKKPLNSARFAKILERVKAGEPGVITGVKDNFVYNEQQIEYLRYFMPKVAAEPNLTKVMPDEPEPVAAVDPVTPPEPGEQPKPSSRIWPKPTPEKDGSLPVLWPKLFAEMCEAYKAGDKSSFQYIEMYALSESQQQVLKNYLDHKPQ